MTEPIQIGIDIGGTKMLMVAVGKDGIQSRQQIATGKQFSGRDAEIAIERFVRSFALCKRIGIAIPGLVDASGMTIACDVLPQLVGWQPAVSFQSLCPVCVLNDAEAALVRVVADVRPKSVAIVVMVGTGSPSPKLGRSGSRSAFGTPRSARLRLCRGFSETRQGLGDEGKPIPHSARISEFGIAVQQEI